MVRCGVSKMQHRVCIFAYVYHFSYFVLSNQFILFVFSFIYLLLLLIHCFFIYLSIRLYNIFSLWIHSFTCDTVRKSFCNSQYYTCIFFSWSRHATPTPSFHHRIPIININVNESDLVVGESKEPVSSVKYMKRRMPHNRRKIIN